ncbi:MAG: hypothetical protein AAF383_00045 [Cyanobacteria bacterium P01_A01_bin.83]
MTRISPNSILQGETPEVNYYFLVDLPYGNITGYKPINLLMLPLHQSVRVGKGVKDKGESFKGVNVFAEQVEDSVPSHC